MLHLFKNTIFVGILCSIFTLSVTAGDIKVGLYRSTGTEGISNCLSKESGIKPEIIKKLDADTLFKYDVIILGSVKGGLSQKDWADAMEVYVKSGGGVMLNHDSTGFRGWKQPLYPTVFQGTGKSRSKTVSVVDSKHSISKNLPKKFDHAYLDHITLTKAIDGKALLKDANGKPVVIAGKLGDGRVVGNGMITGFAYQRPKGNQEKAPEGGEKTMLLNAVRWLAEKPVTSLPAKELATRRRKYTNQINIRKSADVSAGNTKISTTASNKEWFHPSRFNEQGYIHPPVELMPGRFFMFDGLFISVASRGNRPRSYRETVAMLRQMKWAGVTDLVFFTNGLLRFRYPTNIKGGAYVSQGKIFIRNKINILANMEKACAETGIGLWCFWHSSVRGVGKGNQKRLEKYMVKDNKGQLYGHYVDVLNPELLAFAKKTIDELAERYNKHGAIKGIFLDELWHPFAVDYLEDNIDDFIAHCKKEYNQAPPPDIAKCFAKGPSWHNPKDLWWRRYLIWRNSHILKFTKAVTGYANKKGFKIMTQPAFSLTWDMGWFWGTGGAHKLGLAGDLLWSYEGRFNYLYEDFPENRTIFSSHTNAHSGYSMVSLIRGNYGSLFSINATWIPLVYGKGPKTVEVMQRTIRANREWFGAKKLDKTAVLVNEYGMLLGFENPAEIFKNNDALIRDKLSYSVRTSMLLIENAEYFSRYKVLIAPKYALEYLPEKVYKKLLEFVKSGGMLVVCNGKASASNADHTGVVDKTVELLGLERTGKQVNTGGDIEFDCGKKKFNFPAIEVEIVKNSGQAVPLATIKGVDTPLMTVKSHGKGKVVSLNFDFPALLRNDLTVDKANELFNSILKLEYNPPIYAKGAVKIFSNLKKGNWVVATFLHREVDFYLVNDEGRYPISGKLYVDMEKLGIKSDRYRVYSFARDREMLPQGKNFSLTGEVYWTADMLKKQGVDVVLTPNSDVDLKLNYKTDNYYLERFVLPRWQERRKTRSYEHEIIVIAPADEASMLDQEKK